MHLEKQDEDIYVYWILLMRRGRTSFHNPPFISDLITNGLRIELSKAPSSLVASEENINDAELPYVLNRHLSKILLRSLQSFDSEEIRALGPKLVNEILKKAQAMPARIEAVV